MIVVSNTTPVISLASIGRIDLLKELFGQVTVAREVHRELKAKRGYGHEEIDYEFFSIRDVERRDYLGFLLNDLDLGEAETIVLAKELGAGLVIIDERIGYQIARSQGLFAIGTLTILKMAKDVGLVDRAGPLIERMIVNGRWYSEQVVSIFLQKLGEG